MLPPQILEDGGMSSSSWAERAAAGETKVEGVAGEGTVAAAAARRSNGAAGVTPHPERVYST